VMNILHLLYLFNEPSIYDSIAKSSLCQLFYSRKIQN